MSENFDWNYPDLDWAHFHALANLLSLRNGGQAEPSTMPVAGREDWSAEGDDDETIRSIDTTLVDELSNSGHAKLKRKFLDSLAEITANRKGGVAVACSAMKEMEDTVTIWLSRNEGFSDGDESVVANLASLLRDLSGMDGKLRLHY